MSHARGFAKTSDTPTAFGDCTAMHAHRAAQHSVASSHARCLLHARTRGPRLDEGERRQVQLQMSRRLRCGKGRRDDRIQDGLHDMRIGRRQKGTRSRDRDASSINKKCIIPSKKQSLE
jgi:hypothetical protein